MDEGTSVEIKPGTPHRFIGITDTVFFEFSTFDRKNDSYRLTQSGPVGREGE
jgi:hypothetical protein